MKIRAIRFSCAAGTEPELRRGSMSQLRRTSMAGTVAEVNSPVPSPTADSHFSNWHRFHFLLGGNTSPTATTHHFSSDAKSTKIGSEVRKEFHRSRLPRSPKPIFPRFSYSPGSCSFTKTMVDFLVLPIPELTYAYIKYLYFQDIATFSVFYFPFSWPQKWSIWVGHPLNRPKVINWRQLHVSRQLKFRQVPTIATPSWHSSNLIQPSTKTRSGRTHAVHLIHICSYGMTSHAMISTIRSTSFSYFGISLRKNYPPSKMSESIGRLRCEESLSINRLYEFKEGLKTMENNRRCSDLAWWFYSSIFFSV